MLGFGLPRWVRSADLREKRLVGVVGLWAWDGWIIRRLVCVGCEHLPLGPVCARSVPRGLEGRVRELSQALMHVVRPSTRASSWVVCA